MKYDDPGKTLVDAVTNPNLAESSGTKFDIGKIRLELLPFIATTHVCRVLTLGARDYGDHNWRKGIATSRLIGAALRHIFAFMCGDSFDKKTGEHHLAHAICELMFALELFILSVPLDDRYLSKDAGLAIDAGLEPMKVPKK